MRRVSINCRYFTPQNMKNNSRVGELRVFMGVTLALANIKFDLLA